MIPAKAHILPLSGLLFSITVVAIMPVVTVAAIVTVATVVAVPTVLSRNVIHYHAEYPRADAQQAVASLLAQPPQFRDSSKDRLSNNNMFKFKK